MCVYVVVQACLLYQLDYRVAAAAAGWSTVLTRNTQQTVEGLEPGTKYNFRARGGYGEAQAVEQVLSGAGSSSGGGPAPEISWGEYSVESSYVTSGRCAV